MIKNTMLVFVILMLCLASAQANENQPLPTEYFSKLPQYDSLRLSPNGKHYAVTVPKGNSTSLVIVERATMKPLKAFGHGTRKHVSRFYWVNDERLVYTVSYEQLGRARRVSKGEVFATNIDGKKHIQLFGRSEMRSKNNKKRALDASARIVHILPQDPKHILVNVRKWGHDLDTPDRLYKLNIYTQKRSLVTRMPLGNITVVMDKLGQPVFAKGKDRDGKKHNYWFRDGQWQELNKDHKIKGYTVKSTNAKGSVLYLTKSLNSGTRSLFEYDIASGKMSLLFNHPTLDINNFIRVPGQGEIIGVELMEQGISYQYFDKQHPFSQLHRQVASTFPDKDISFYANSMADNEIIVKVKSDKNPGDFYLFDREKSAINYVLSSKPWIDPKLMNERDFVQFKSRDGETIYGYLTLPKNASKDTPLVVDVHGGPYGVQDKWYFASNAQFLASRGYAVLQVNFRGSGGYGKRYEQVAYRKRSTMIQHDIIDGTRWAMARPDISNEKACIMGGSFGGYSAVMAPSVAPDLYKCSIAFAGAYDLNYQIKEADYMSVDSVSHSAVRKYGKGKKMLTEQSPITHIAKIKIPVFIQHGGKDRRVPPEHAKILRKAFDKSGQSYEWLFKADEGHGFVDEANRKELFEKNLAFLDKYLK